jgi:hypothetical protein
MQYSALTMMLTTHFTFRENPYSICINSSTCTSSLSVSLLCQSDADFTLSPYLIIPHLLVLFHRPCTHSCTCICASTAGIGESKSGLPLGRLTLRIASMSFPSEEYRLLGPDPLVRLRVNIRGEERRDLRCAVRPKMCS